MKTPRYISRIIGLIRNLKTSPNGNMITTNNFELTNTGLGISLKKNSRTEKGSGSLLSQLYCEENETLFI